MLVGKSFAFDASTNEVYCRVIQAKVRAKYVTSALCRSRAPPQSICDHSLIFSKPCSYTSSICVRSIYLYIFIIYTLALTVCGAKLNINKTNRNGLIEHNKWSSLTLWSSPLFFSKSTGILIQY